VIVAGPGRIFIAERPRCPTHGPFAWDGAGQMWVCHGYDGEGCGERLSYDDWWRSQAWHYIGDTEEPTHLEAF
jgi:hypothetical protein